MNAPLFLSTAAHTQTRLQTDYLRIRQHSLDLIEGLSAEDCQLQSMPEASPAKWHLAHSTWFLEQWFCKPMSPASLSLTRPTANCSTATTTAWGRSTRGTSAA